MRYVLLAIGVAFFCLVPLYYVEGYESGGDDDSTHTEASSDTDDALLAGNNAWMMTSCALVLFMTAPGLALFYCGLVRRKNVLSLMMQCIFLMGLMTIVWSLWGYSLCFGGTAEETGLSKWIGNGQYLFMNEVQGTWDEEKKETVYPHLTNNQGEDQHLPLLTHMLFQGMFFIITPALICGAFAERIKFSTLVVFMVLWNTLVYCPLCHWMWDGGWFAQWGAIDFAGGAVVHISSGVAALVCALFIGKRLGLESESMPPHNLTYTVMGTAMLWFGWFGFNAGSGLASDGWAASAFAATHLSAAAGAITWPTIEWIKRGKPTVLGTCSGAIAGLACITPASGYVSPIYAILVGVLASICCYYACTALKARFGYDDSLDVFGIHGIGGTLGMLLTGIFATRAVFDVHENGSPVGLIDGGGFALLGSQAMAVGVTFVFTIVITLILLNILDATMGLRITQEEEIDGIDLSQHGEEGYISV